MVACPIDVHVLHPAEASPLFILEPRWSREAHQRLWLALSAVAAKLWEDAVGESCLHTACLAPSRALASPNFMADHLQSLQSTTWWPQGR